MTISDLGALGEFIGSLVVLVTLIYVAVQVQQTKKSVQSATWQGAIDTMNANNHLIIQNEDVAELVRIGMQDPDSLSATDWFRFGLVLASVFHVLHKLHGEANEGSVNNKVWEAEKQSMQSILLTPGGLKWWREATVTYSVQFRAYVDAEIELLDGSESVWKHALEDRSEEENT